MLADTFGRLNVCLGLVGVYVLTGIGGGLTNSLGLWLILRFLMGAASIGMTTVRYTMQAGQPPQDYSIFCYLASVDCTKSGFGILLF